MNMHSYTKFNDINNYTTSTATHVKIIVKREKMRNEWLNNRLGI